MKEKEIITKKIKRISWDKYFIEISKLISKRGTCSRKKVGAVIVKDNDIISTGYNGSPKGMEHCSDIGCLMENKHCIRTIHAEQNALLKAGKNANEAILYCTDLPCPMCFKMCIQSGINKIIYINDYNKNNLKYWIKNSGIKLIQYKNEKL